MGLREEQDSCLYPCRIGGDGIGVLHGAVVYKRRELLLTDALLPLTSP